MIRIMKKCERTFKQYWDILHAYIYTNGDNVRLNNMVVYAEFYQ